MMRRKPLKGTLVHFRKSNLIAVVFGLAFSCQACVTESESELLDEELVESNNNVAMTNVKLEEEPVKKSSPGKGLPIPQKPTFYNIRSFMEEYREAYAAYIPLGKEYRLYFKSVNSGELNSEESVAALKLRIRENFDRAHWVFLGAIQELSEFLLENSKNMLHVDKEENFIARMKAVSFMATELTAISQDSKYVNFAREVYIYLSERHLGRSVKKREEKRSAEEPLDLED